MSQTMEGESSKSSKSDITVDLAVNLTEFLMECDGEGDLNQAVKQEMLEEVMHELYKQIMPTAPTTCTSNPTPLHANIPPRKTPDSLPSLLSLYPPLGIVSDGKSESCGPSVSDSSSTMMVGVEFVGTHAGKFATPERGLEHQMDGSGDSEFDDDEWVARVLGWDLPEF